MAESAFDDRNLDGLKLKILNRASNCPEGRTICDWVTAATDAIEKTYLRDLVLAVYINQDKPEDAIETYTFHFDYYNEKDESIKGSGDAVKVGVSFGNGKDNPIKFKEELYKRTILLNRQVIQVRLSIRFIINLESIPLNVTLGYPRIGSSAG